MATAATTTYQPPPPPPTWPTPKTKPSPSTAWPPPALFMKMELGLSLAPTSSHQLSLSYATRPITSSRLAKTIPNCLLPSSARRGRRHSNSKDPSHRAPRARSEIIMRPAMAPAYHTQPPHLVPGPDARPFPQRTSSLTQSSTHQPLRWPQTRHFLNHKPLPELPSRFRLGEADLPWTSPAPSIHSTSTPSFGAGAGGSAHDGPWSAVSPPSTTAVPRSISTPSSPVVSPILSTANLTPHKHHPTSVSSPASPADAAATHQLPRPWSDSTFWTSVPGPRSITPPGTRVRDSTAREPETSREAETLRETEAETDGEHDSIRAYEAEVRAKNERSLAIDPLREREMRSLQAAMMSFDALGAWEETSASLGMTASATPHHHIAGSARGDNPRTIGWAVRIEPDGRRGVVRDDDDAGWQRYNSEEWERAGRTWTYRDVNGFRSYWPDGVRRRSSWGGGERVWWGRR